jgi:hypothetical protein
MITPSVHIRRLLRSARAAALTPEERREELRAAEARITRRHGGGSQPGGISSIRGGEPADHARAS